MPDYMKLLQINHPNTEASCSVDTTVYANITFHVNPVSQATLDSEWLDYYKSIKNAAIDARTRELFESGFTWNSVVFSMSETAQRNWLTIDNMRNDLTYPFGVSTKADSEYQLTDATEAHNFALTAVGVGGAHYGSGRALKLQVNAAVDEAGVDAVVDNR